MNTTPEQEYWLYQRRRSAVIGNPEFTPVAGFCFKPQYSHHRGSEVVDVEVTYTVHAYAPCLLIPIRFVDCLGEIRRYEFTANIPILLHITHARQMWETLRKTDWIP